MQKIDEKTDEVRERLDAAWVSGRTAEVCGIFVDDIRARCIWWLLRKFPSIAEEDAEDCVDDAFEGVLTRGSEKIHDVYNYLFTSAKNKAVDLVKERKQFVLVDPEWLELAGDDRLFVVAEAALDEELTLRVGQLRRLFALVLPKLAKNRQRLVALWLDDRVGSSNEVLAELIGISKGALKSLKSRTLSDLRELLPASAYELEIDFEQVLRPVPEVLSTRPSIPCEENGEGRG